MASRARSRSQTLRPGCDGFTSSGDTVPDGDVHMGGTGTASFSGASHGAMIGNHNSEDMQALGQHSRQLIQTVQNLADLNIDNTLPSLPKFVVVGDQSAGKSSIIEATCDITLPRAAGTCTRCPFQITTKHGLAWSCKIAIHYEYAYVPDVIAGRNNAYDKWTRNNSHDTLDLATVYTKDDLVEALRKAQLVVLNPTIKAQTVFMNPHVIQNQQSTTQFSPNVVALSVEGPGLPEMSFYDLPGSINVFQDAASDFLVKFVERLIKQHVKDEKTLILLACAADQDVENSTSFRYIRECKAVDRCMGVLTKPDLLNPTRVGLIADVLSGRKFGLGHGWKVVKSLSQQELDDEVQHEEARNKEHNFFDKSPIWGPGSELSSFSSGFGVPKLQNSMSETLTDCIINDLPEIRERVMLRYDVVCGDLLGFPEKPLNARLTVENELREVETTLAHHIVGDGLDEEFRKTYRQIMLGLKSGLRNARPVVKLVTPGYKDVTVLSDGEEDSEDLPAAPTPSKRKAVTPVHSTPIRTPASASRANGNIKIKAEFTQSATSTPSKRGPLELTIDGIEKLYANAISGLPNQRSPRVTEHIIGLTMQGWTPIVKKAVHEVEVLFQRMIKGTINHCLSNRKQLATKTIEVALDHFNTVMHEQAKIVDRILQCELHKPNTVQDMRPQAGVVRAQLEEDRLDQRVFENNSQGKPIKLPSPEERRKIYAGATALPAWAKLPADPYAAQVEALVTPLTYYDIASARFVDSIILHFELGLLDAIKKNLAYEVRSRLKTYDEQECDVLLAEHPQREQQRVNLVLEKEKLEAAVKELDSLPGAVSRDD